MRHVGTKTTSGTKFWLGETEYHDQGCGLQTNFEHGVEFPLELPPNYLRLSLSIRATRDLQRSGMQQLEKAQPKGLLEYGTKGDNYYVRQPWRFDCFLPFEGMLGVPVIPLGDLDAAKLPLPKGEKHRLTGVITKKNSLKSMIFLYSENGYRGRVYSRAGQRHPHRKWFPFYPHFQIYFLRNMDFQC